MQFIKKIKNKKKYFKIYLKTFFIIFCLTFAQNSFAVLTCTITASCVGAGEVKIMNLSATDNATSELPSQANYTTFLCCSGVAGLGNSCSGLYAVVGTISSTTNAHFEENTETNYTSPTNDVCISNSTYTPTIAYSNTSCAGYDDEIATISGTPTNSHIGASYTRKICGTVSEAISMTYSVSDPTIGFGTLSTSSARYATGDGVGSGSETVAHTIAVTATNTSGYSTTVQGDTLTHKAYPSKTITAIGGTATASAVGTEQFGLRITASGGTGAVSSPYNHASNYAYDATASVSDEIATASTGDGVTTTYSVRYLGNISTITDAGDYETVLTYITTGNF